MSGGRTSLGARLGDAGGQARQGLPISRDMFRVYRAHFPALFIAGAIVVAFAAVG